MENTTRRSVIASAVVLILVAGVFGFKYFLNSNDSTYLTPPRITINYPKYKGSISGDVVCQIPGTYTFTEDKVSTESGAIATLQAGIHIYHSDTDITVQKIIDKIDSVNGNKILIAYYPSLNNTGGKFSVYKGLPGQNALDLTTTIPANEGFTIFSCKESKIHGIKTETEFGSALPTVLGTKPDNGWVLMAAPQPDNGKEFKDKMKDAKGKNNKVKSAWAQEGVDFDFGDKEETPEQATLKSSYKMVWVEFGAAILHPPVTNLKAALSSDSKSISLTWTAPASSEKVGYIITTYNAADGSKLDEKTTGETIYKVTNTTPGISYRFGVDTLYPDSVRSGSVSSGIIKVPSGSDIKPITNLNAKLSDDGKSINVTWNPPATTQTIKYTVSSYAEGSKINDNKDITDKKFTLQNIAAGKSYYFTVIATYPDSSVSSAVTSNTLKVPAGDAVKGVTNLKAIVNNNDTVSLTWTAPTDKLVLYSVSEYIDNGSSPATFVNTFGSDNGGKSTKFTTPTLVTGKSYYFTVVTEYLDQSKSDPVKSNVVSLNIVQDQTDQPATPPSAPGNIKAKVETDTTAFISWDKPTDNGGDAVTKYNLFYGVGACSGANPTGNDTIDVLYPYKEIKGLTQNTKYGVYVRATNSIDNNSNWSDKSTCVEFTTLSTAAAAPTITAGPTFNYTYDKSTYVYWNANNTNALNTKFRISYLKGGCSAPVNPTNTVLTIIKGISDASSSSVSSGYVAVLGNPYTLDLTPGTTYGVTVAVTNDSKTWSQESSCKEFKTTGTVSAPSAPGKPTVSETTINSAKVSWTAPSNTGSSAISDYLVSYTSGACPADLSYDQTNTYVHTSGLSYIISSLAAGSKYSVWIEASNGPLVNGKASVGWSPDSQCTEFTTKPIEEFNSFFGSYKCNATYSCIGDYKCGNKFSCTTYTCAGAQQGSPGGAYECKGTFACTSKDLSCTEGLQPKVSNGCYLAPGAAASGTYSCKP